MKLYQHYKGGLYIVTEQYAVNTDAPALHDPTHHFVHYYDIQQDGQGFVRPFEEFHEKVEHEGKTGPRFRFIADPADIMPNGGHP